jgi:hypothetical protein
VYPARNPTSLSLIPRSLSLALNSLKKGNISSMTGRFTASGFEAMRWQDDELQVVWDMRLLQKSAAIYDCWTHQFMM